MSAASIATPEPGDPAAPIAWEMPSDREVVARRTFDAPRRLVFEACTTPEHVRSWYGPRSQTMTACEIDFRVGGSFRYAFRAPDGGECAFSGEYREIVRPERVVNSWRFEPIPGSDTLETATFEEVGGRTLLTVHVLFQSPEHYQGWAGSGARAGMAETWDRLAELVADLAGREQGPEEEREIVQTRTFDAPRELVFAAWTEPEHLGAWWGPDGFSTTTHEADVRPGGVWRFTMHGPDGTDWPNRVLYQEITRPERLFYLHGDFEREHFRVTVTFEEEAGRTRVTMRSVFPTAEARARVVEFGAVELGRQTLGRLADYLASM